LSTLTSFGTFIAKSSKLGSVAKFDGIMIFRFSEPLICCTVILF